MRKETGENGKNGKKLVKREKNGKKTDHLTLTISQENILKSYRRVYTS